MTSTFLAGTRLRLADAPVSVRHVVTGWVGGAITHVRDCQGGMSQGVASVVTGPRRTIFVKAISDTMNSYAADAMHHEAEALRRLPRHPSIPALVHSRTLTDASDDWVVLAQEPAAGSTPQPWTTASIDHALAAWQDLARALTRLDTALWTPTDASGFLSRWDVIAASPDDPWSAKAVAWQHRCGALARSVLDGRLVVSHVDLRADNILIDDSAVSFVDWAHSSLAAPWLDPLLLVLDVAGSGADLHLDGTVDVQHLWATHPTTRHLPPEMLSTGAAALAGGLHVAAARTMAELPHRNTWAAAMANNLIRFAEATDIH